MASNKKTNDKINNDSSVQLQYPLSNSFGNKYLMAFHVYKYNGSHFRRGWQNRVVNPQKNPNVKSDPTLKQHLADPTLIIDMMKKQVLGSLKTYTDGDKKSEDVLVKGSNSAIASIYLQMPESLTDTSAHSWDSVELGTIQRVSDLGMQMFGGHAAEAAGQLFEQTKKMILNGVESFSHLNVNSFRERNVGIVVNPNMEMLYQNSQIKQHTFAFKFMPTNQKESIEVKKICEMFKFHAAPTYKGALLSYPSIFLPEFHYGGEQPSKRNWLYTISPCALTSVEVNYADAGQWASFKDGAPVAVSLNLQFSELGVQTKQDIKDFNEDWPEITSSFGEVE